MDFYAILGRAGRRVSERKKKRSRTGISQLVSKGEAIAWFKQEFDGLVLN